MIGWVLAIAGAAFVYRRMNAKPGVTTVNPQPVMAKPLPQASGGVGLAVMTAQPQMEQSRAAILAANVPYQPATTVLPDVGTASGSLPIQAGDYSLVPPPVVSESGTPGTVTVKQGPVSVEPVVPLERTEMVGTLIDFGGNLL